MEYKMIEGHLLYELQDKINNLAEEEWKVLTMTAYPGRIVVMMERDSL